MKTSETNLIHLLSKIVQRTRFFGIGSSNYGSFSSPSFSIGTSTTATSNSFISIGTNVTSAPYPNTYVSQLATYPQIGDFKVCQTTGATYVYNGVSWIKTSP